MRVNLARTLARSACNGPGERFVIWTQGCPLACVGCWNRDTWEDTERVVRETGRLVQEILGTEGIEGVTFTGGEPFLQAEALAELARPVRAAGMSILIFTGYELFELVSEPARHLLALSDIVVAGRYEQKQRTSKLPLLGSTNQRTHFLTDRYGPGHLADLPSAEAHIDVDGRLTWTGFPSPGLLARQRA